MFPAVLWLVAHFSRARLIFQRPPANFPSQVPDPNAAQANATNNCVADCPKGNGTASDNLQYADCVAACIGANYYTSTGTPGQTGAAAGSGAAATGTASTTGATGTKTGSNADKTGTTTGSGTGTASGSSASATTTKNAGEALRVTTSAFGLMGLVAALIAL